MLAIVVHVEAMLSIRMQDDKHVCWRLETYEKVLDIRSMTHALTKLASCGPKRVGTTSHTGQILNDGVQQGPGLDCGHNLRLSFP